MKLKFIAIAALGKNRELGLDGKIPWNFPDEHQHFLQTIKDQYVLVGRKNFEAHGCAIPGAKPIVLSKSHYSHPNAETFSSVKEVMDFANEKHIETIYVIGGAQIYDLLLPYVSEFLCSVVDYEGSADTYFPEYLFYEWEIVDQKIHPNWTLYHMKKAPTF